MEDKIFEVLYSLIERYTQEEDKEYKKHYIAMMIDELKSIKEKEC